MDARPELWRVAQSIEGLVCRVGEHAGGVIFVDEPFVESTALMKVPNGDIVTQFDLHDCEDVSLIKIDLLSVECLDKIHNELDLLIEHGKIEKKQTLKETYESVIGIYNLERDNPEMWQMVWDHKIQSLFQMEKQSGISGIATLKPTSVDDLAVLNSTIRLMAQEGATERPTDKLARFKRDPEAWNKELKAWGLGAKEKAILEPVLKSSYGLCIAQEQFMQLVQLPELGGFNLTWADKLRKSIAKKNPKEFDKLTNEFYKVTTEKGIAQNFAKYVWEVLISMSKGYGFNQSHTLAYSLVALQEMNLAYRFPLIYWNTACLITDTGGAEDLDGDKSNNYDKLADGINKMQQEGITVYPPDINKASFTFQPDEESNHIMFGLRGILGVGSEVIDEIMSKRPFTDLNDFMNRTDFNKQVMVSLIKSGALDSFGERKQIMRDYLWEVCDKKKNLNLQNLPALMTYKLLPTEGDEFRDSARVYNFNRYLKSVCKSGKLDNRATNFLIEINCDNLIKEDMTLNNVGWKAVYDKYMNVYRTYIINNKQELLDKLNNLIFNIEWDKYALGNYSSWEMETICYYYHNHELENINKNKYGIVNYFELPEEPVVERTMEIKGKTVNFFKLTKICGTCLSKNKSHGTVKLLTTDGVVEVRFGKEYFSIFDRTIKLPGADGKMHIAESSWFDRGSLIMVQGIRSGDQFIAKKYKNSGSPHRLYKITEVKNDGDILLTSERVQGETDGE